MIIGGFLKNSFIDFPGNISAVIFTAGCNFKCDFCHNSQLIPLAEKSNVSLIEIFDFLVKRRGLIDAVVITGGEPTIQSDLKDVVMKIKKLGYLVKLDTNGSNPYILEELLSEGLLDYVAMDVKEMPENYDRFCKGIGKNIEKSMALLKNSGVPHEFRTTFEPRLSTLDIEKIAALVGEGENYFIQKYNLPDETVTLIPHKKSEFDEALKLAQKHNSKAKLRGF